MQATINFPTLAMANDFIIKWGRKTLTGHDRSAVNKDGSVKVTVYDVTEDKKEFIDSYIKENP
jgi:hypothetical protein